MKVALFTPVKFEPSVLLNQEPAVYKGAVTSGVVTLRVSDSSPSPPAFVAYTLN